MPQSDAAYIAEKQRVDAYMNQKLAERRAAGVKTGGSPETSSDVTTQHSANNVRQWFTPPAMQAVAKAMGAQPIGDKPTADQAKQLQRPNPLPAGQQQALELHPAVQRLANDLASHKDIQQAMTGQLAKHPAVQAAAMQHADKKDGVPDDAATNLRASLVKLFEPTPQPQNGMQQLQGSLNNQQQQPDQGQQ